MQVKIDSDTLKGPLGVVVAILVIAAAVGWMHLRRQSLIEQGSVEVERYLETELPARYVREHQGVPDPERVKELGDVEVIELSPSWFFRADRDDTVTVKAVVRIGSGETATFYLKLKRVLGRWRLEREQQRPLLETFG